MFRQMMQQWWVKQQLAEEGEEPTEGATEMPSKEEIKNMKRRWWKRMQERMQSKDTTEGEDSNQDEADDVINLSDSDVPQDRDVRDTEDNSEVNEDKETGTDNEQTAGTSRTEAGESSEFSDREELLMKLRMKQPGRRGRGERCGRPCGMKTGRGTSETSDCEEPGNKEGCCPNKAMKQERRKAFRQMMKQHFIKMMEGDNDVMHPWQRRHCPWMVSRGCQPRGPWSHRHCHLPLSSDRKQWRGRQSDQCPVRKSDQCPGWKKCSRRPHSCPPSMRGMGDGEETR